MGLLLLTVVPELQPMSSFSRRHSWDGTDYFTMVLGRSGGVAI